MINNTDFMPGDIVQTEDGEYFLLLQFFKEHLSYYDFWEVYHFEQDTIFYLDHKVIATCCVVRA